jgi:DNA polymerase III delta subunit
MSSDLYGYGRLKESTTLSPSYGETAMTRTQWGVANPDQLAELTTLIEDYAKEMGINGDKAARDRLAARVMDLFNEGVKPEEMRRRLDSSPTSL